MKRTFIIFGLFLALGLTATVFNSCDKDDDIDRDTNGGNASKIIATNIINGSTVIKTVRAHVYYWQYGDSYRHVIARAPYQNNSFTLELYAPINDDYLETIDYPEGIFVSDENFKSCLVGDIIGYDVNYKQEGLFYLRVVNDSDDYFFSSETQWWTQWMYVDRDVTIKGEYKEYAYESIYKYDLKLKKGWNIVYKSLPENYENGRFVSIISSKKPSGVNYTWHFDYNDNDFRH